MKTIITIGLCLVSGVLLAQGKLSFNPEKGSKYEYKVEIKQSEQQSANNMELPIEETVNMEFLMNINEKEEVRFTWQNISYLLSSPILRMEYDSKKPKRNPTALDNMHEKILGSAIGKSFSLSIAPDGSISSITGVDIITEASKQAVASDVVADAEMGEELHKSLTDNWIGEDALKKMIEQSFNLFHSDEVNVGDSWTKESVYNISNGLTFKNAFTLKSIKNGSATISVKSIVEQESKSGADYKLTGTQSGNVTVNTKTGIPISSDLTVNVKGRILIMQRIEGQMNIVERMKSTIKEVQ